MRRWGVVVVAALVAGLAVAAPVVAQDGDGSGAAASTVRIKARLVESGKVEFGLQLDGEREWLPRARLFPYATATVGSWLFASPYTLSDGTVVRIQARRVASGKVEFGLQLDGEREWLPRARLFPYATATVGSWLFASPYTVPATDTSTPPPTTFTTVAPDSRLVSQWRWLSFNVIGRCGFEESTGECRYINDGWTAAKIIEAVKALLGQDCEPVLTGGVECGNWDREQLDQRISELGCPEGWQYNNKRILCYVPATEVQSVRLDSTFLEEWQSLDQIIGRCRFEESAGECRHVNDGWTAAKIIEAVKALLGQDCEPVLAARPVCGNWDWEQLGQRISELGCPEGWQYHAYSWHFRYTGLCYSQPLVWGATRSAN